MRCFFFLFPCLIYGVIASAQTTFSQIYFSERPSQGIDVVSTPDKGFLILGDSLVADGYADVYLIKTDSLGEKQWSKSFGYGGFPDYPQSIISTYDGGYLIAGYLNFDISGSGSTPYPIIYKLDSAFNIEWSRDTANTMGTAWCSDVVQTPDSGYLYTAATVVGGATLMKTDKDGKTEWIEQFGLTFNDGISAINKTNDGGYIMTGQSDAFGGPNRIMVRKLDSSFNEEWIKFYGDTTITVASDIIELWEGGFALTGSKDINGNANYEVLVMKISALGDSLWLKTYGGTDRVERGVSLVELDDSSLLVSVGIPIAEFADGNGILKLSATGDSLWLKPIGVGTEAKLARTSNGVVVTGSYWHPSEFISQAMLIKLDSTCYFEDLINGVGEQLTKSNEQLVIYPNPFTTQATVQFTNPNNEQYSFMLYDSFGRVVLQKTANENEFVLQRGSLVSGIYFYQLNSQKKSYSGKVVIR